ncbi:M16 family metallopeptidase [Nonomuraea angiospora]
MRDGCTELELDNGLRAILAEDRTMPVVTVAVRYGAGARHESHSGQAHLLEHLMFQGSRHVAPGEHVRLVESLGGRANARTSMDSTYYAQTLPKDGLELALWLEGERMGTFLDTAGQDRLDAQRKVVVNERLETIDNIPYGTAEELLLAHLFPPGHPYHHHPVGTRKGIETISLNDLTAFFTRFYTPRNAVVAVVGDFPATAAAKWVKKYLGQIPAAIPPPRPPPEPAISASGVRRLEVTGRVPCKLFLGHRVAPAGTPAFDTARVTCALLGHGRGGLLWRRLAHDRDLVTDLRLRLTPLVGGASLGIAEITPRPGVTPAAVGEAYQEELAAFSSDDHDLVTDLRRATTRLESGWAARLETTGGRAEELTWHALLTGAAAHTSRLLPRLREVTAADVRRCAAEWAEAAGRVVLTYQTRSP